jgi:hypothetical protein
MRALSETLHLLSLGAGVQSSTLALMAARGLVSPMPDAAIFADTQAEPASVYAWLDYLEAQLPYPVYRVTKGSLTEESTRLRQRLDGTGSYIRQAIPGYVDAGAGKGRLLTRGCTRDYKIRPIVTQARRLKRAARADRIVQWYGISVDEAHRMKDPPEHDFVGRWPLVELGMTRADCLQWMADQGYPVPPRSACSYCPFHSDKEWLRLKRDEPEAFAAAVAYEQRLQAAQAGATKPTSRGGLIYLHVSLRPLAEVEFADRPEGFGNECAGVCGV